MATTGVTLLDAVLLGIILGSLALGFFRGLVREALSIVTWCLAIWVSFRFTASLSGQLSHLIHSATLRYWLTAAILFSVILIVGSLVNMLISRLVRTSVLGGADRILGTLFGVARGLLLASFLIAVGGQTSFVEKPWWKSSFMVPRLQPMASWMRTFIEEEKLQKNSQSFSRWLTADLGDLKVDNS